MSTTQDLAVARFARTVKRLAAVCDRLEAVMDGIQNVQGPPPRPELKVVRKEVEDG